MALNGRVAIVTGAGSGIGAGVAERLRADGAEVVAVDRDAGALHAVAGAIGGVLEIVVDIADSEQVGAAVETVVERYGRIDVLANIAGVDDPVAKALVGEQLAAGAPLDVTSQLSDEQWRRVVSINLDGTFHFTRATLRVMLPAGHGSIVNMASLAGVSGVAGIPHYSAAKAGIIGFTQSVAKEVADRGVRVNVVAPGAVITPMTERSRAVGMSVPAPIGRWADVSELAAVVAFLAGDESSYITGETINVNGGVLAV